MPYSGAAINGFQFQRSYAGALSVKVKPQRRVGAPEELGGLAAPTSPARDIEIHSNDQCGRKLSFFSRFTFPRRDLRGYTAPTSRLRETLINERSRAGALNVMFFSHCRLSAPD